MEVEKRHNPGLFQHMYTQPYPWCVPRSSMDRFRVNMGPGSLAYRMCVSYTRQAAQGRGLKKTEVKKKSRLRSGEALQKIGHGKRHEARIKQTKHTPGFTNLWVISFSHQQFISFHFMLWLVQYRKTKKMRSIFPHSPFLFVSCDIKVETPRGQRPFLPAVRQRQNVLECCVKRRPWPEGDATTPSKARRPGIIRLLHTADQMM